MSFYDVGFGFIFIILKARQYMLNAGVDKIQIRGALLSRQYNIANEADWFAANLVRKLVRVIVDCCNVQEML